MNNLFDYDELYKRVKTQLRAQFPLISAQELEARIASTVDKLLNQSPPNEELPKNQFDHIPMLKYPTLHPETPYIEEHKKYYDAVAPKEKFAQNRSNYIGIEGMTKRQKNYYFYWRNEVRKGNYIKTDDNYILILGIEYVYGIGYQTPEEPFEKLKLLYQNYQDKFNKIDYYLYPWICHFALFHNLELESFLSAYSPHYHSVFTFNTALEIQAEKDPSNLSPYFLDVISRFDIDRSRLPQNLLLEAASYSISQLDEYTHQFKKTGFLNHFSSAQRKTVTSTLFPHVPDLDTEEFSFKVRNFLSNKKFVTNVTEIIRLTENTLRTFHNIRGRLQKIMLDQEVQEIITQALNEKYNPNYIPPVPLPPEQISLDFKQIDSLRDQSNAVRDALEVQESPPLNSLILEKIPESPKPDTSPSHSLPEELNSLPSPWLALYQDLDPAHKQALHLILSEKNPRSALQQLADQHFSMVETFIDDINNIALTHLDDIILELKDNTPLILEEYQSPLENLAPFLSQS